MLRGEMIADIVGRDNDGKIRQQRQQKAEALHAARNMDRLAIAIGEVDDRLVHARSTARANIAKAALAAAMISGSSPGTKCPCSSRCRKLCQRFWPLP